MASEAYTKSFFEQMRAGSVRSAEIILPLVQQLLPIRSVVDVGCGDGNWLAVFRRLGVEDILGVDGDYVGPETLQIPAEQFRPSDLTQPLRLNRSFDLAMCLEVAEHLPASCAATLIESLVRLAPVVLFSAAIPFQGGNHHINEQWPDEWAALFKQHNYVAIDCIRRHVWRNDAVEWWYAQNVVLFAHVGAIEKNKSLKQELERTNTGQLSLVHPKQYLYNEHLKRESSVRTPSGVREASRMLVTCMKNSIKKRMGHSEGNGT